MRWLGKMLIGLFGSSKKIENLDLTEVSKAIAQQLAEKPMTELERKTREFKAEHRAYIERYNPDGTRKAEKKPFGTVSIGWHAGAKDINAASYRFFGEFPTVEESDLSDEELEEHIKDLKIGEATAASRRLGLGEHVSSRMAEIEAKQEIRNAERLARRRAEAETARKLAAAQAEAAELEEIAQLAVAEVDARYARF